MNAAEALERLVDLKREHEAATARAAAIAVLIETGEQDLISLLQGAYGPWDTAKLRRQSRWFTFGANVAMVTEHEGRLTVSTWDAVQLER
jgi:hypothetical protein